MNSQNKNEKIVIAGGTGFLGQRLAAQFVERGSEVFILTRGSERIDENGVRYTHWDGKNPGPWQADLEGADVLINLTGKNVNCRYTETHRREIMDSRCDSVALLGIAVRQAARPPRLWLQASSLAIHGDTGKLICDESADVGLTTGRRLRWESFPVEVCQAWENAFHQEPVPGTQKVTLRISFVLAAEYGALALLAGITRWGFGGTILPGIQYISWIHIDDFLRAIDWLIENDTATGIYGITGPNPETNRDFMAILRKVLHRPWSPPVPRLAVEFGTWLLRSEPALPLAGRRCVPTRLINEGFQFRYPDLKMALQEIYHPPQTQPKEPI